MDTGPASDHKGASTLALPFPAHTCSLVHYCQPRDFVDCCTLRHYHQRSVVEFGNLMEICSIGMMVLLLKSCFVMYYV